MNYTTIIKWFKGDRVIWVILLLLSLLSLLIVYSSTGALAFRQADGNTMHYLIRQIFFLALGIGLMLIMVNVVPVKFYSYISQVAVYASIGLLAIAFGLKMIGHAGDSSGRTLNLGFFSFQPAEFAKISLIMYSSKILGKYQKSKEDLFKAFKSVMFYTGIICGLIFFSNFSSAALLFATIMSMMFIGRVPVKFLAGVILAGVILVGVIYFTAEMLPDNLSRVRTIKGRLERFIHGDPNSEKGITQADYAKLAIYKGGLIGKGPGSSDVSNFMAAAYNDFIFAIIIEEYGLFFGIALMFLYLIFFFRGVLIVRRATRTFPAFLVTGLTLLLVYQAMINIGVSSGVFPVTGQPLPWVSMGGTSTLFTSIAFGCILSVSYQNQKNQEVAEQPVKVNAPDEDEVM